MRILLVVILIIQTLSLSAQTDDLNKSAGPGLSKFNVHGVFGSTPSFGQTTIALNFEAKFFSTPSEKVHLYGRVGYLFLDGSKFSFEGCDNQLEGRTLSITFLKGKKNHHFEANSGVFIAYIRDSHGHGGSCDEDNGPTIKPYAEVGYRYQKPEGGFIFRAKIGIFAIGVGLGYAF